MKQRTVVGVAAAGMVAVALVGVGLVVARGGGSGSTSPPTLVLDGSRAYRGGGAADAKRSASATSEALAPALMPVRPATFTVEGTLPALGGKAAAYQLPASFAPSQAQAAALAAAFGVTAPVEAVPADSGGGWRAGPADGTGPSVQVGTDALGSWWYSATSGGVASSGCAVAVGGGTDASTASQTVTAVPADTVTVPVPPEQGCTAPPPPAGVPSADQARALATTLLSSLGYDLRQWRLDVQGDEYQRTVTAQRLLDGIAAPLYATVAYGGGAAVQWASGSLAEPQRLGDYPTVDTAAAFARLRSDDARWGGGPGPIAYAKGAAEGTGVAPLPAGDAAATPAASGAATGGSGSVEPGSAPAVAPGGPTGTTPPDQPVASSPEVTVEPPGAVEPYVVTITGVERTVVMVWHDDGTLLLAPGYAFLATDGGRWEVVAVDDRYVAPAPTTTVGEPTTSVAPVPETTPAAEPATTAEPELTAPVTTAPNLTVPDDTVPGATVVPPTVPEVTTPAVTVPAGTVPADPCPSDGREVPCTIAETIP